MPNFLRVGDVKLPTAAYAKSLQLPKKQRMELISFYEQALKANKASSHKWKQFRHEKRRYKRMKVRNQKPEGDKTDLSVFSSFSYLYYRFFGGNE